MQSGIPAGSMYGPLLLSAATSDSLSVKSSGPAQLAVMISSRLTCSLLKPDAKDLLEKGTAKGDLFFRTSTNSTGVKPCVARPELC